MDCKLASREAAERSPPQQDQYTAPFPIRKRSGPKEMCVPQLFINLVIYCKCEATPVCFGPGT
jgi:hypothetical protein